MQLKSAPVFFGVVGAKLMLWNVLLLTAVRAAEIGEVAKSFDPKAKVGGFTAVTVLAVLVMLYMVPLFAVDVVLFKDMTGQDEGHEELGDSGTFSPPTQAFAGDQPQAGEYTTAV